MTLSSRLIAALNKDRNIKENLALGCGGIRGLFHLGVLKAFHDAGLLKYIKRISGTSIGGMMGFTAAIGIPPQKAIDHALERQRLGKMPLYLDFIPKNPNDYYQTNSTESNFTAITKKLYNAGKYAYLIAKNTIDVPLSGGLCHGLHIEDEVCSIIQVSDIDPADKNDNMTLMDLHKLIEKYPHLHMKDLYVKVTNITNQDKYFSEVVSYETHPDMPIRVAIHATMAVPGVYKPVIYNGQTYVDGGIFDAVPVTAFDHAKYLRPGCKLTRDGKNPATVAVALSSDEHAAKIRAESEPEHTSYLEKITNTVLFPMHHQDEILRHRREHHRMIFLKTNKVPMFDFVNLSSDTINVAVNHGYEVANNDIKTNNYQKPLENTEKFQQFVNIHQICNSPWLREKPADKKIDQPKLETSPSFSRAQLS